MTNVSQIPSGEERWSLIPEFPDYFVSDRGRVLNQKTGHMITPTYKVQGLPMVGMMKNGIQHKRGLALLVATAFVPQPNKSHDTPINLNGSRADVHFTNLAWRPKWFARDYMKQFQDPNAPRVSTPIQDVETGYVYNDSMHAATMHGLLDTEIYISMVNNTYVWLTGQVFREVV